MRMRVFGLLTAFALLYPHGVRAQDIDLLELYESSQTHKPFARFAARTGVPGHAFVILGEELDNGLLFTLGVFGFYPIDEKASVIKALYGTDGVIEFKWDDLDSSVEFRTRLTSEQTTAVQKVLKKWGASEYSLLGNNCNKLTSEVAAAIGLKLPKEKSLGPLCQWIISVP